MRVFEVVTTGDIGKTVTWYDFAQRVMRRGTLKGLSADGRAGYVMAMQPRNSLRAKAPRAKMETHPADALKVFVDFALPINERKDSA